MPLVVELEEGRGVRVLGFEVQVVRFGLLRCVTTVLTDVHLQRKRISSLLCATPAA